MLAHMKQLFIILAMSMAIAATFGWPSELVLRKVRTLKKYRYLFKKKYQYASWAQHCNLRDCVFPKLAILTDRLVIMILLPFTGRLIAAEYNFSHTLHALRCPEVAQ